MNEYFLPYNGRVEQSSVHQRSVGEVGYKLDEPTRNLACITTFAQLAYTYLYVCVYIKQIHTNSKIRRPREDKSSISTDQTFSCNDGARGCTSTWAQILFLFPKLPFFSFLRFFRFFCGTFTECRSLGLGRLAIGYYIDRIWNFTNGAAGPHTLAFDARPDRQTRSSREFSHFLLPLSK